MAARGHVESVGVQWNQKRSQASLFTIIWKKLGLKTNDQYNIHTTKFSKKKISFRPQVVKRLEII